MRGNRFPSHAARALVVFALTGWSALAGAQAVDPAALCGCVTQVKQSAARQIEEARAKGTVIVDVDGNLAVAGQRVRIGSAWSYDASRNACVGSYEYWQQSGAEWRLVDTVTNVVDLAQAAASCRSLGPPSGPAAGTSPPPATALSDEQKMAFALANFSAAWAMYDSARQEQRGRDSFFVRRLGNSLVVVDNRGTERPLPRFMAERVRPGPPFGVLDDRRAVSQALNGYGWTDAQVQSFWQALQREATLSADRIQFEYINWRVGTVGQYLSNTSLWTILGVLQDFRVSSEHGSVRGTINGGGDFLSVPVEPTVTPSRYRGRAAPRIVRAAYSGAPAQPDDVVLDLPAAVVSAESYARVVSDLASSRIAAVSVVEGQARVRERATGVEQRVSAGQFVVIVPGVGVTPPQPIPPDRSSTFRVPASPATAAARPSQQPNVAANVPSAQPGGPLKLAVFAGPPTIVGGQVRINVQVQDSMGRPVCTGQPVSVRLDSQNSAVLKPYYSAGDARGEVTIGPSPNNPNVGGTYFDSRSPGTATITASAPGLTSGSATVRVLGRPERATPPVAWKLYVGPSVVPTTWTDSQKLGSANSIPLTFVVQMQDANGNPTTNGKRFDLKVTSSDPSVSDIGSFLFYGDGGETSWTHLNVTPKAGVTTLSVSGGGLRGDSARVETFACGTSATTTSLPPPPAPVAPAGAVGVPSKLAVFAGPPMIIGGQTRINVQVQDAAGQPVCLAQPIAINLSTQNKTVLAPYYREGDERGLVTIGPSPNNPNVGGTYFDSKSPGTATVVASAPGLASGSATVTVLARAARANPPVALKLYVGPAVVPATRPDSQTLGSGNSIPLTFVVQMQDANGHPTTDGKRFDVKVTSTDPAVSDIGSFLFYGDGGETSWTHLNVTPKAGTTTLSVSGGGLRGDSVRVQTFSCAAGSSTPPPADSATAVRPRGEEGHEPMPSTVLLRPGESWNRVVRLDGVLAIDARLVWEKPAGANYVLDVSVNGRPVVDPLVNKMSPMRYADGRNYPYREPNSGRWLLFYSADYAANNGPAGGGYQVMTDPGRAYRYEWDVTSLLGGNPVADVRFTNSSSPPVPIELRVVTTGRGAEHAGGGPGVVTGLPGFGEGAASPGRVSNIVTARDVQHGAAIGITDRFTPDVNPIHVWFRISGFAPGTKLLSKWTYLGGSQPLVVGTAEIVIDATNDYGTFNYELAPGKRWPAGAYRIEILRDTAVVGTTSFEVR